MVDKKCSGRQRVANVSQVIDCLNTGKISQYQERVQTVKAGKGNCPVNLQEISTASGSSRYLEKHSQPRCMTKAAQQKNKIAEKVIDATFSNDKM